ncbi:MAG TPA: glycosyltransferase family 4 protein [Blastocatellia bacterium]
MRESIKLLAIIEAGTVTGSAKNLIEFARRARPEVETCVVTFRREAAHRLSPVIHRPFALAAREAGLEVEVIDERYRFDRRIIERLREVVASRAPDIIQSHNVKSHFLVRWSGIARARPWIAFHHGYTTTDWKMRLYNQLDRWSLKRADRIITVSRAFARQIARIAREDRITVLHNSINIDSFSPISPEEIQALRANLGIAEDERVLLAVGRMSREKGHADLISAFASIVKAHPRVKLIIAGDGLERKRLEQQAASSGLGNRVLFTGRISDASAYYSMADVFALPSHSEGSPNVLLEAMAAGVPVVATRVGGVPEIVTDEENALLVAARDEQAMAGAIARLFADGELSQRLAAAARERVRDYSPEARLQSLLEIYRRMVPVSNRASARAI